MLNTGIMIKLYTLDELSENARQKAIDWQTDYCNNDYSYGELAAFTEYFTKLAKRYGLITEFRENGII